CRRAGHPDAQGRTRQVGAGRRPGRLPDPAGGADQHPQARWAARQRARAAWLHALRRRLGGHRRRRGAARPRSGGARGGRGRRPAGTGWPGCSSGPRPTVDTSRPARAPARAGGSAPACGSTTGMGRGLRVSIRVLLVDDQSLLRLGFRLVLEAQPDIEVVGEAGDGAQAIAMTRVLRPDVVLMDVRMPVLDGIHATRQIIASRAPAPIPVLTTFNLGESVSAALRAGASGFLLKAVPPADLLTGIRAVAAGDAVVAPSVTRRLLDAFASQLPDPSTGRSPTDQRLHQLTDRER